MTRPKIFTESELLEWIEYYEKGGEFEDDIMTSILQMALLHAKHADRMNYLAGTID